MVSLNSMNVFITITALKSLLTPASESEHCLFSSSFVLLCVAYTFLFLCLICC